MADVDERRKLFAEMRTDLSKIYLSNAENFDKHVLAYSIAALGFSLGFLKDFVPITQASHAWLLYASWAMFVASVVATMSSFHLSQRAIRKQLRINERYYLEGKDDAIRERNLFAEMTDVLNYFSAISFVTAIVCTTAFVGSNLEKGGLIAEQKKAAPAGNAK